MDLNWPLLIALALIALKQLYKLFLHHKPDRIDYIKTLATIPVDVCFLVVGLFVKAAIEPASPVASLLALMIAYIIVSIISTILWRVCDTSATRKLGGHFWWAFPLNAGLSCSMFFLAIEYVR